MLGALGRPMAVATVGLVTIPYCNSVNTRKISKHTFCKHLSYRHMDHTHAHTYTHTQTHTHRKTDTDTHRYTHTHACAHTHFPVHTIKVILIYTNYHGLTITSTY